MAAPKGRLNLDETPACGSRSIECYDKLDQIGEGTYGQVFRAKEKTTGEIVALKKIRMDNEREGFPITAIRELKILKRLQHENVVQLKEVINSPGEEKDEDGGEVVGNKFKGSLYMVFEYMDHDLTGLSNRPGVHFSVPQIKCYMKQLLTGLHYCHIRHVLHRDMKCANILIDNKGTLKIADFGLSRIYTADKDENLTNKVVTLWYRPPELLMGSTKYGPEVDMWSIGCIFAELLHGQPILPGKTEPDQLDKIRELFGTPERPLKRRLRETFRHFDHLALDLLEKMLTLNPKERISARSALDAEYFWVDPLPCDPESLPNYESSHEFQTKKKRRLQDLGHAPLSYNRPNQNSVHRGPNQSSVYRGPTSVRVPNQTAPVYRGPNQAQVYHGQNPSSVHHGPNQAVVHRGPNRLSNGNRVVWPTWNHQPQQGYGGWQ